jgi:hypothetical protein
MAHATAAQPITVGSTPTWTATSPTPTTSSAAASAPAASHHAHRRSGPARLGPRARPAQRLGRGRHRHLRRRLARFLATGGRVGVAVNRPDRQARRRRGRSDPTDAEAAARAVQAGQATVTPRPEPGSWR